jgi:hypothetical protein
MRAGAAWYPQVLTDPKGASGEAPLVVVYHRHDGAEGWHIFSKFEEQACECPVNTDLCSMLELDVTLTVVLGLPVGWMARRGSVEEPWIREPITVQDTEPGTVAHWPRD